MKKMFCCVLVVCIISVLLGACSGGYDNYYSGSSNDDSGLSREELNMYNRVIESGERRYEAYKKSY